MIGNIRLQEKLVMKFTPKYNFGFFQYNRYKNGLVHIFYQSKCFSISQGAAVTFIAYAVKILQIKIDFFSLFKICFRRKEVCSRTRRTTCNNNYYENRNKMSISPVRKAEGKPKYPMKL